MKLIDILFLNNHPFWIIGYLSEMSIFLQINREWREKFLSNDLFCNSLLRSCWWFRRGIHYHYKINYECRDRLFRSSNFISAMSLCRMLFHFMAKQIYLVCRPGCAIGCVFSPDSAVNVTNHWSRFNFGKSQIRDVYATVRLIQQHGFIEVMSDKLDCKSFLRSVTGMEHYMIENMFGKFLPYYWLSEGPASCSDVSKLVKWIVQ